MEYTVREAAELLNLSEKEIEDSIRSGMLIAELDEGEWIIPEWSIRVFQRTRDTLKKIETREDGFSQEGGNAFETILEEIRNLSDINALFDSFVKLHIVLQKRVFELEDRISELKLAVIENKENHKREILSLKEQIAELNMRISDVLMKKIDSISARIDEVEGKITAGSFDSSVSTVPLKVESSHSAEVQREGFWSRFLRMLTWD